VTRMAEISDPTIPIGSHVRLNTVPEDGAPTGTIRQHHPDTSEYTIEWDGTGATERVSTVGLNGRPQFTVID